MILKYFLITDLITNERYTQLFDIKQEKANFTIKELKMKLKKLWILLMILLIIDYAMKPQ